MVSDGSSSPSRISDWPSLTSSLRSTAASDDRQHRRDGSISLSAACARLRRRQRVAGAARDRACRARRRRRPWPTPRLLSWATADAENAGEAVAVAALRQQRRAVHRDWPDSTRTSDSLAAMLHVHRLEHIGERSFCAADAERAGGLRDAGRLVAQRLHQPQHAVRARGRSRAAPGRSAPRAIRARDRRTPHRAAAGYPPAIAPSAHRRDRRASPASRSALPSRGRDRRLPARPLRTACARDRRRRARARDRRSLRSDRPSRSEFAAAPAARARPAAGWRASRARASRPCRSC